MSIGETYQRWLSRATLDAAIIPELAMLFEDSAAIEDRFYRELEFGTGGLRGVLGAGSNRMNLYTVAKATQGYANYLVKSFDAPTVAIGYDSRKRSDEFARTAAAVFAANGIVVHLFPRLMPTPALSFAVRDMHCSGGVVITASHNPAQYNGYKVYDADGCQITTEVAKVIQQEIDRVDVFDGVLRGSFEDAFVSGAISYIGENTVQRYLQVVATSSVLPEGVARDVSIVYTPLNGAGISCVPQCLAAHGFTHIVIPTEQAKPDGNFPTCVYPNPEIHQALEVGLTWAHNTGSDLLLATDPDCDRVGAAVRNGADYTLISGNEMGVLLLDFLCRMRQENGTMPGRPVAVKTIVTTPMAAAVAKSYGVELVEVLTGFKFIGEQIGLLERAGEAERYIFGFEESCGYLSVRFIRDKDAVNASLLICEMFAWYRSQRKTLVERLDEMYHSYGFYRSRLLSFTFEGSAGFANMRSLMESLRRSPMTLTGSKRIERVEDYLQPHKGLPASNVLRYYLEGGAEVVVRPSGTEPKLKIYLTAAEKTAEESMSLIDTLDSAWSAWVSGKA